MVTSKTCSMQKEPLTQSLSDLLAEEKKNQIVKTVHKFSMSKVCDFCSQWHTREQCGQLQSQLPVKSRVQDWQSPPLMTQLQLLPPAVQPLPLPLPRVKKSCLLCQYFSPTLGCDTNFLCDVRQIVKSLHSRSELNSIVDILSGHRQVISPFYVSADYL